MELVHIVEDMPSEWDGTILSDEHGNEYIQEYPSYNMNSELLFNQQQQQQQQPQMYLLNSNNTIVPIESLNNLTFFADVESDDGETPSYVLDHMYAKKPREPGTEQAKPVRRRSKKKEQSITQCYVEELLHQETPKINIIRQRLPMAQNQLRTASTRPKILQGSHSSSHVGGHDTNYLINNPTSSLLAMATTLKASSSTLEYHLNMPSESSASLSLSRQKVMYDDYEVPEPGEMVTIADNGKVVHRHRKSKLFPPPFNSTLNESLCHISNLQSTDEKMVSVALLDQSKNDTRARVAEEEVFFEFEEPEGFFPVEMDVEMDDIELTGNDIVVTCPKRSFDENPDTQSALRQARKKPQTSQPVVSHGVLIPKVETSPDDPIYASLSHIDAPSSNKKHVSWKLDHDTNSKIFVNNSPLETDESEPKNTISNVVELSVPTNSKIIPAATRRSTRPVKLPARLDDPEVLSPKRKRR